MKLQVCLQKVAFFQEHFEVVSRKFQGCFKTFLLVYQGCFKGISSKLQWGFKMVSRKFQGCYMEVSKVLQECFKNYNCKEPPRCFNPSKLLSQNIFQIQDLKIKKSQIFLNLDTSDLRGLSEFNSGTYSAIFFMTLTDKLEFTDHWQVCR